MPGPRRHLRHILLPHTASAEKFISPGQTPRMRRPARDREAHAQLLLEQLSGVERELALSKLQTQFPGVYLEFESELDFPLMTKSLDLKRDGIELLAVREDAGKTFATVYVPDDKLQVLIKKIEDYRTKNTKPRIEGGATNPLNAPLIDTISNIRRASLRAFWTDLPEFFPTDPDTQTWWEVWLRASPKTLEDFQEFCTTTGIELRAGSLSFQDRIVVLIFAKPVQLEAYVGAIPQLAELRLAKETALDFTQMPASEQHQWADALKALTTAAPADSLAVCLLDTGVTREHPLIDESLNVPDTQAYNPAWGAHDHAGHGTEMAGLALYGDLADAVLSTERIELKHRLESVKILPPAGANPPELYGEITKEAVARAAISAPARDRIVCMAVTTTDSRDRGQPSSWSAALDQICFGGPAAEQGLFFVSAGNVAIADWTKYPDSNDSDSVHDPGQSWNSITVGACTFKDRILEARLAGWTPIAPVGGLSPASTTSLVWKNIWPIKPDIVFEGGNGAQNPTGDDVDNPDSLALLSTYFKPSVKTFVPSGDTSAATALAARSAAQIASAYSALWPETVRALLIHSAEWTPAMRARFPGTTKASKRGLLRSFGFGVPNQNRALWSANNYLTLVVQEAFRPFNKGKMNEMHLHDLPWPAAELAALGETQVQLRVTLSYFIEPNPGRRGWEYKHRYQSHGLRFDVKTPTESLDDFRRRINRAQWEDSTRPERGGDSGNWLIGEQLRSRGSIHSDIWEGNATDLASRKQMAVFPVSGWWRERHQLGRWQEQTRYSLIVSIATPREDVDIYTPIEAQITIPTEIRGL